MVAIPHLKVTAKPLESSINKFLKVLKTSSS